MYYFFFLSSLMSVFETFLRKPSMTVWKTEEYGAYLWVLVKLNRRKERVLELAVFFPTLWNNNWENVFIFSKLCHTICNTETDFVLLFTNKIGLLQQAPQGFWGKQGTKWKFSCFPYHLHSHAINMGKFLKLNSQFSSRFVNNFVQKSATNNLFLNFSYHYSP